MRVTAIIQARMGSTRLPGKVLLPLFDKTVLGHVISRLQQSLRLDDIVVATTTLAQDDEVAAEAKNYAVRVYRGSENDVLDRFLAASRLTRCDWIVRITADCPLVDSCIVDAMLTELDANAEQIDYLSNTLVRTFPRGLDVEILAASVLRQVSERTQNATDREHVTPYVYRHPELYRLRSFENQTDYSHYRWTLDTPADWQLIQAIYGALYPINPRFSWQEALQLLARRPDLAAINGAIQQKEIR